MDKTSLSTGNSSTVYSNIFAKFPQTPRSYKKEVHDFYTIS